MTTISRWQRWVCVFSFFVVYASLTLASITTGDQIDAFTGFIAGGFGVLLQALLFVLANRSIAREVERRRSGAK